MSRTVFKNYLTCVEQDIQRISSMLNAAQANAQTEDERKAIRSIQNKMKNVKTAFNYEFGDLS